MSERHTLNLLVVNGRPEARLAIASTLESLNEHVVLAASGDEALRHLLQQEFALILLDMQLPDMDGFEAARMIKAWPKTRNVPLIFTSASPKTGLFQSHGYALGAVDYLPPPLDPVLLRAKASVFLDLARQNAQLREQAAELALQVRYKDEFLAIVSHELNTPLSVVVGFTELLSEDPAHRLGPEEKSYIQEIVAAADRLQALVNDLLDMGRIQAGRLALQPEPTDLGGVVKEALQHVDVLVRRKKLELVTAIDEVPAIAIDRQRMRQVWVNLLNNALTFTPEGGRIAVAVRLAPEGVRCEIKDTGPGIPPELQDRIFERFGQVDTTSTRRTGGTGLGLSISKAIVEGHGGRIGVDSTPGEGSTFWFTLPVPAKSVPRPSGSGRSRSRGPRGPLAHARGTDGPA